jgi:hypothetical protein
MEKARHHVPMGVIRVVNTVSTCVFVVTAILVCCTADTLTYVHDDWLVLAIVIAVGVLLAVEGLCMWLTDRRFEGEEGSGSNDE